MCSKGLIRNFGALCTFVIVHASVLSQRHTKYQRTAAVFEMQILSPRIAVWCFLPWEPWLQQLHHLSSASVAVAGSDTWVTVGGQLERKKREVK